MFELALVAEWLAERLKASPLITDRVTGGVWHTSAHTGTPRPYIVLTYGSGTDMHAASRRAMSDAVFQVVLQNGGEEGVTGSYTKYLDVLREIDRLLDNVNEQIEHEDQFVRVTPKGEGLIQFMEVGTDNQRIAHQGRSYRILIRAGSN